MPMDSKMYTVEMTTVPKEIYSFRGVLTDIPIIFFAKTEKTHSKRYMQSQRNMNSQNNVEKKKCEELSLPNFKA